MKIYPKFGSIVLWAGVWTEEKDKEVSQVSKFVNALAAKPANLS